MSRQGIDWRGAAPLISLPVAVGLVVAVHALEGGSPRTLLQPTAAVVVFGGTLAALALSFPWQLLKRTAVALRTTFTTVPEPEQVLVDRLAQFAARAKRRGTLSLEGEIASLSDPFLARAVGLVVDGASAAEVRHTLSTLSSTRETADEECAHVLEAAAGYAPTLGILGAVIGLIQVMESLATPVNMGSGIAVAFVATVYGVGSANLLFLPMAARLRGLAHAAALNRDLIVEAAVAIQQGQHPRIVEGNLHGLAHAGGRGLGARSA